MKMYEMIQNYQDVLRMFESDELTEQDVKDAKEFILAELEDKSGSLIYVNTQYETEIAKCKELIRMITDKKKSLENQQKRFKETVKTTMEELDIKTVKTPMGNLSIRKGQDKLFVEDETLIPKEYQIVDIKIDNKALRGDLKNGKEIAGASLVKGENSISMPKPKF